jgi:hypothetical protein
MVWDCISLVVFAVVGIAMLMLPQRLVRSPIVQAVLLCCYLYTGHFIMSNNRMYYSDRAFVAGLCWGFAAKIFSYFNSG